MEGRDLPRFGLIRLVSIFTGKFYERLATLQQVFLLLNKVLISTDQRLMLFDLIAKICQEIPEVRYKMFYNLCANLEPPITTHCSSSESDIPRHVPHRLSNTKICQDVFGSSKN